jgi:hypothetical protein
VFDNVDRATLKVYSSQENVAGVKIPKFESVSEPGETKMELTGALGGVWSGAQTAHRNCNTPQQKQQRRQHKRQEQQRRHLNHAKHACSFFTKGPARGVQQKQPCLKALPEPCSAL